MDKKEQLTQDELRDYLQKHDVKLTRLAEMMGYKNPEPLMSCFKHHKDWHGRPRKLNAEQIAKLNEAMPRLADELLGCRLEFNPDPDDTNRWGSTYDKKLVEPIKRIGNYLNITKMLARVCGWSKGKKSAVLCSPNGKMNGWISNADVLAINSELKTIAGDLKDYEVVIDTDKGAAANL